MPPAENNNLKYYLPFFNPTLLWLEKVYRSGMIKMNYNFIKSIRSLKMKLLDSEIPQVSKEEKEERKNKKSYPKMIENILQ